MVVKGREGLLGCARAAPDAERTHRKKKGPHSPHHHHRARASCAHTVLTISFSLYRGFCLCGLGARGHEDGGGAAAGARLSFRGWFVSGFFFFSGPYFRAAPAGASAPCT